MVKYLFIFLILAAAALFYPFRDLYVRDDAFSPEYTLAGKGYWSQDACREAAEAQHAEDFRCRKRTLFGAMVGTTAEFNQADQRYSQ